MNRLSMKPPRIAIVREPPGSFGACVSSHPLRNQVNVEKAKQQHSRYCRALRDLGLELLCLDPEELHPDSCFVEDTAVVRGNRALIARLGEPSRRGEESSIAEVLTHYVETGHVRPPGTLEGGDVIHLPSKLLVGVGRRTNEEGVRQLSHFLGVEAHSVSGLQSVHLKSNVTYLGQNTYLSTLSIAEHPVLSDSEVIVVPPNEEYAANTLTIGDSVLMSSRHETTLALVRHAGFEVIPLNLSEFEKCDGALTCLSLLV
jgi:dimethylargininase